MTNEHVGSLFEDFLVEEGIQEEVQSEAIASVLAWLRFQSEHREERDLDLSEQIEERHRAGEPSA